MRTSTFLTSLALTSVTAICLSGCAHAEPKIVSNGPEFKVLNTIPLGGDGEWGYPAIDTEARRIYLPRTNVIQVLDLDKGALAGTIPDVSKQICHGTAIASEQKLGFASAGKDNNVATFDPVTLEVRDRVNVSGNPNFTLYDPASKRIVVMSHTAVTIIDPNNLRAKPISLEVGAGLESAVADGKGNVFVSVENEDAVVRIDTKKNVIADRWPVAPCKTPAGITMDTKTNRLFVTCHGKVSSAPGDKTGMLAVIDAASGKVLATSLIGAGASGAAFDPSLGVVLAANGKDGTVSVVKETSSGKYETIQTLKTILGARHVVFDPQTRHFFLEADLSGKNSYAQGENFGVISVGLEGAK